MSLAKGELLVEEVSGNLTAVFSEQALVAYVLEDYRRFADVSHVPDTAFCHSANGRLWTLYREFTQRGVAFDIQLIACELEQRNQLQSVGGYGYLSALIDDFNQTGLSIPEHMRKVLRASRLRQQAHVFERMQEAIRLPGADPNAIELEVTRDLQKMQLPLSETCRFIQRFDDIPDILTLKIPPPEYFVHGLIARETVIQWSGLGGKGKSWLMQKLAVGVATGTPFLGMQTKRANVLFLDYQNPGFVVQQRLQRMTEAETLPNLKVWGKWMKPSAPPIGSDSLLRLVEQSQPLLLIIDPLRAGHSANENDSGEMIEVMNHLTHYSSLGTAVSIVHHLARNEDSISRGSTAIYDAVDLSLRQVRDQESGIVQLANQQAPLVRGIHHQPAYRLPERKL